MTNSKPKDKDTLVYVGQKAFIKKGNKILVLRDPHYVKNGQVGLDFPGGRFRYGGDPEEELLREVDEETGLVIKVGKPFTVWTNKNHARVMPKPIYLIAFICTYQSGEVTLSDEHDKFEWVDKNTYKNWHEDNDYFKALDKYFKQGQGA